MIIGQWNGMRLFTTVSDNYQISLIIVVTFTQQAIK